MSTYSPSQQKIKTLPNAKPRFERIRIVEKNMPQEIRLVFQKPCELLGPEPAEKLKPYGVPYPEPFRVRPNFFIPILAVCSYVLPFFMLMLVSLNLHIVPGLPQLMLYLHTHGDKIYIPAGVPFAIFAFGMILAPMLVGGLLALALSKNPKLSLKKRILIWFVPTVLFVSVELLSGAFLTNEKPYPKQGVDSAYR